MDGFDAGSAPAEATETTTPAGTVPLADDAGSVGRGIDVAHVGSEPEPKVEPKAEPKTPKSASDAIKAAMREVEAKNAAERAGAKAEAKAGDKAGDKAKDTAAAAAVVQTDAKPVTAKTDAAPVAAAAGAPDPAQAAQGQPPAPTAPTATAAAPQGATGANYAEPPPRFSNEGKAAWAAAPDAVKAEVHRAIGELEQGYHKHRAAAEAFAELREFDDMARQHGTSIKQALTRYTNFERAIHANPVAGLEQVVNNLGIRKADGTPLTLYDVAAHIMGRSPEQATAQQHSVIAQMQAKIDQLEQASGQVMQRFQQTEYDRTLSAVEEFAKSHPRILEEAVAEEVTFFLKSGRAKTLPEAYQLAERLIPAPAQASPSAAQAVSPPVAEAPKPLNPAGQKSISGAPKAGQSAKKGAVPSIRESIRLAAERA